MLSLDIKKTLKLAIKNEQNAQKLYLKLIKKTYCLNTKNVYKTIFQEEIKHELILKNFLETENFTEDIKISKYYTDADSVLKKFDIHSNIIYPTITQIKDLMKGLKLAMKEETKYANFYLDKYEQSIKENKPKNLQNLFYKLSIEEKKHLTKIKKEYNFLIKKRTI